MKKKLARESKIGSNTIPWAECTPRILKNHKLV